MNDPSHSQDQADDIENHNNSVHSKHSDEEEELMESPKRVLSHKRKSDMISGDQNEINELVPLVFRH